MRHALNDVVAIAELIRAARETVDNVKSNHCSTCGAMFQEGNEIHGSGCPIPRLRLTLEPFKGAAL